MKLKFINYLLIIYLLIQPFLDVCAITDFSYINLIIRTMFFIFMFIYLFVKNKYRFWLIIMFLMGICYYFYFLHDGIGLFFVLSSVLKLYYLPVTLFYFSNLKLDFNKQKYFIIVLFIYIILYLLSYIFNFGYEIYLNSDGKDGFRGVFNSINELSAIIIILLLVSLDYLKRIKNTLLSFILIVLVFLVSLLAGTKVLTIGIFISIIIVYMRNIIGYYLKISLKKRLIFIICSLLIIILFCSLMKYTRFYNNMLVQADFFKVNSIFSLDFINKVIFNNRLTFLYNNFLNFISKDIFTYIFGIGYFSSYKLVEIDIFDIIFRFGFIGFITFLIPILIIFKKTKFNYIILCSVIFMILLSLTSGHVLLNPNVLIYMGYMLCILNDQEKLV